MRLKELLECACGDSYLFIVTEDDALGFEFDELEKEGNEKRKKEIRDFIDEFKDYYVESFDSLSIVTSCNNIDDDEEPIVIHGMLTIQLSEKVPQKLRII